MLQNHIHACDVWCSYNADDYEPLDLTVQDVADLYNNPNEEKQAEFERLAHWYTGIAYPEGYEVAGWYSAFALWVREQYKEMYGKPFVDKENAKYSSDDIYALVLWGIENADCDFANEVYDNYQDSKYDEIDRGYADFLYGIGLIGEKKELKDLADQLDWSLLDQ